MLRSAQFSIVLLIALMPAACVSDRPAAPQPATSTRLPLDPMDDYDYRGWWVGDDNMLLLNRDQSYILFNGLNQYLSPTQRGRWSEMTYASLRLEPYGRLAPQPMRVRVELHNGGRALYVPDLGPMFAADAPPRMLEDEFMGTWSGDSGDLQLDRDMRYTYTPSSKWMNAHAMVLPARQRGQWRLVGGTLTLSPFSPAIDATVLTHSQDDDVERLTGDTMAFEREVDSIADAGESYDEADADDPNSSTSIATGDDGQ